jgi:hypothetical protein
MEPRRALFIGLNPSWADAKKNDATVRRLNGFCLRWSVGEYAIVNMYAYRTESPKELAAKGWPVGPDNDIWIAHEAQKVDTVVCMWGAHAQPSRVAQVWKIIKTRPQVVCFGLTKGGTPKHPLYLPNDTKLVDFTFIKGTQP